MFIDANQEIDFVNMQIISIPVTYHTPVRYDLLEKILLQIKKAISIVKIS
jgi:hypothetical protein